MTGRAPDTAWTVYLLRCADNTLYCGCTNDLARRVQEHRAGRAAKYTKGRRPVKLAASRSGLTKAAAHQLEYAVKRLPRREKVRRLG